MKKQIQTPQGFFEVDSWNPEHQKYFSDEEMPTAEQIAIKNAYLQAIADLQAILDTSATPVIDTIAKAQIAIRALIVSLQKVADIEMKELKYHKRGIDN